MESEEWFVVEAERAIHGTWEHIAPQISKQLAAVGFADTRQRVLQLAPDLIKQDEKPRALFKELGTNEFEVHGRIEKILRKKPTIAIPVDAIPKISRNGRRR